MLSLARCAICHRYIWPWRRRGWRVTRIRTEWFHTDCYIERRLSR